MALIRTMYLAYRLTDNEPHTGYIQDHSLALVGI